METVFMDTITSEPDVSKLMMLACVLSNTTKAKSYEPCVSVNYVCLCFRDVSFDGDSNGRRPRKQRLSDLLTEAGAHEGKHTPLLHRQ